MSGGDLACRYCRRRERVSTKNSTEHGQQHHEQQHHEQQHHEQHHEQLTFASDAMPSGHSVRFCCSTCVVG